MKKYIVKWGWADTYGRVNHWDIHWEENEKEATEWIEFMKNRNHDFFKVAEIKTADYAKYLRIQELEKELAELKKEF